MWEEPNNEVILCQSLILYVSSLCSINLHCCLWRKHINEPHPLLSVTCSFITMITHIYFQSIPYIPSFCLKYSPEHQIPNKCTSSARVTFAKRAKDWKIELYLCDLTLKIDIFSNNVYVYDKHVAFHLWLLYLILWRQTIIHPHQINL